MSVLLLQEKNENDERDVERHLINLSGIKLCLHADVSMKKTATLLAHFQYPSA